MRWLILALCLLLPASAGAQYKVGTWIPLGCAALPSMASATRLSNIPSGATLADIQVSGANVLYTDDGSTPTTTYGMIIFSGAGFLPYAGNIAGLQLIQATTTATGTVCYYR